MSEKLYIRLLCAVRIARLQPRQVAKFLFFHPNAGLNRHRSSSMAFHFMNGLLRDELNCYFLLELTHEYRIESIVEKCHSFMVFMVKEKMEKDVLTMLIYGQKYHLKTLTPACIDEVRHLSLKELKQHKEEIEPDNYLQIAEGIIQRLETLETQCKVKQGSLKCMDRVCESLYRPARAKVPRPATQNTTDGFLDCLVNNTTDGF